MQGPAAELGVYLSCECASDLFVVVVGWGVSEPLLAV